MQNRYAGDIGDFGKLGLLRFLAKKELRVGVNWYLVEDESGNSDGKHTSYLSNKAWVNRLGPCDPELFLGLSKMVLAGQRSIFYLETMDLIPGAVYYSEVLNAPGKVRGFSRVRWHKEALHFFRGKDLVFLDPDNGLIVKSVAATSAKSVKYILPNELEDHYGCGYSLVFYNHRSRQKEEVYLSQFQALKTRKAFHGAVWFGLRFRRGPVRDFVFILQKEHSPQISCALRDFLNGPWKEHWAPLPI